MGASGLVGREMLSILLEFGVPEQNIFAAASQKSAGTTMLLSGEQIEVFDANHIDFANYDIALFSAGSKVSEALAPRAAAAGCWVIDNSSHFRMHSDIPLIIPEVNFRDIRDYAGKRIIANPNCSTIQMVLPLSPLHEMFDLKELVVSTYQSVSGAGQKGLTELSQQISSIQDNQPLTVEYFKKQIANNIIPQIDAFTESMYTKEEIKMINETKKILELDGVDITATCVRVPVFVGHAVSVFAKFRRNPDIETAIAALKCSHGIRVANDVEYETPIDVAGRNEIFVSRIRKHPTMNNGLSFWCVADNLRKGAALNAVQIAIRLYS